MIDTIILRLHDIKKYETLIRNLDTMDIQGFSNETMKVNRSEMAKLRKQRVTDPKEQLNILKLNRAGDYIIKTKAAKQVNVSNHYSFTYFINYTADYVEFNFSIPKYVYGSNVPMFVDHNFDKEYNHSFCTTIEHNIDRAYERLQNFLDKFFTYEFLHCHVDYEAVEVHRIDVCFNQVFRSKEEALLYHDYQKRLTKKYTRNDEGKIHDYATSLMFVTKRYSAKIYHKGSEYAKNDLREHLKLNQEKGYEYFKVQEYQSFADKILRYELTLRNTSLNYLHKRNLFRANCPYFKSMYKDFLKVESIKQRNDRISKKAGTLPEAEKKLYLQEHKYERIDKDRRNMYKYVLQIITKRTRFKLSIDDSAKRYNRETVNYNCPDALFSKGLLKLCLHKLFEFMVEFRIKELPQEEKIQVLIDHYNATHRRSQLPVAEMIFFYKKLSEIGSFKETVKFCQLSKATLFRYKARFKKIGITEQNLIPLTEYGIPNAPMDLYDYHAIITYNPAFITKDKLLYL